MMPLAPLDWLIVACYLALSIGIGLYFKERASSSLNQYFLSNRSFPWWLAGTSMVATTFSADTPLAVTGFVAKQGIAGNWFWWVQALSTITVTFFFARLWRRSHVLTDVEFLELRYSAKPAAFLRGLSAIYRGLLLAVLKLSWVIVAMQKVLEPFFGDKTELALIGTILVVLVYSVLSGYWGVVITDFLQFGIAMAGSIWLAILALQYVGGIDMLQTKLIAQYGAKEVSDLLAVFPPLDSAWMPPFIIIVYLGLMWWADARVEGGAYIAQRLMSAKDERHATFAALWFNIAHYALRPWPWIIVALVSMVVWPDLADKESGYPKLMALLSPVGVRGLMITAFFAAFMSTVDTLVNWASSYLVNDAYKRFWAKEKTTRHYVRVAKCTEVLLLGSAYFLSQYITSITFAWKLIVSLTAGLGLVYIARWFWWRVNAWSEVTAMVTSGLATLVLQTQTGLGFEQSFCITLAVSTAAWITVTFLTPAVSMEQLKIFYRRTRPLGFFCKPVRRMLPPHEANSPDNFWWSFRCWIWGIVWVYSSLFGIGKWIFGDMRPAIVLTAVSLGTGLLLWWELKPATNPQPSTSLSPVLNEE